MPLPPLPDELLEEIFLRLPPDEPEHLVRASVASKLWLGLLSGARFRGRYRELHGVAPMLGFLRTWLEGYGPEKKRPFPLFTSTTKFGTRIPGDTDWRVCKYHAWDCRHGRVLLGDSSWRPIQLAVWNPMTGSLRKLGTPDVEANSYVAAVLCAVSGCDHYTCHAGPFQVVFVVLDVHEADEDGDGGGCFAQAWVSSPDTGEWSKPCPQFDEWSEPCPGHLAPDAFIRPMPPVLVQDAVHFMLEYYHDGGVQILKYDLNSSCLSLLDAPPVGFDIVSTTILMAMEDASLGFAHVDGLSLYLWSRQMGSDEVASWTGCRVIGLGNILPIQNPDERIRMIGSVEGRDIVFVTTDMGIYEINLKSLRWKKLCKREKICALIPYMNFYSLQERVIPQ